MKARFLLATGLLTLAPAAWSRVQAQAAATNTNVILYIGDGFGIAPKTAARMAMGQGADGKRFDTDANFKVLAMDKLRYNATVTTHSLNSWITDSGPGAAVYASGKKGKIDNDMITLDPTNGQAIETILEAAKKQGYAVGLVSTARITHATPAAFASHMWNRDLEDYIAAQYIASTQAEYEAIYNSSPTASFRYSAARDWVLPTPKVGVELDVLLGGGARHFLPAVPTGGTASPSAAVVDAAGAAIRNAAGTAVTLRGTRADGIDLVKYAVESRNYKYVNSRDALTKLNLSEFGPGGKKLLGLFTASHVSYEQDRQTAAAWEPSIAEMTRVAIQVLTAKANGKGFFLMVESGRIDHMEHSNTGGIAVVASTAPTGKAYTVDVDQPVYVGGGDAGPGATPTTARTTNIYASDYLIKEVMAFDYAIAEGRSLLANRSTSGNTLLFTTSDHECGGVALTGLHDEADFTRNGTKIRTYADGINKSVSAEAGYATPSNLVRGDGGTYGFFPQYVLRDFQGFQYPEPASATARRIVVAYGSNPLTNGNGVSNATGQVGNHTPQDVWVGADDNTNGSHAGRISGQGLLDNTALTPIMASFLNLTGPFVTGLGLRTNSPNVPKASFQMAPVPFEDEFNISFDMRAAGTVSVVLLDGLGRRVATVVDRKPYAKGAHRVPVDGRRLAPGLYQTQVTVNGQVISQKTIKQ
ncbi:alkaline phosphatase [uncultured Hymenobacter sp.]|uniref:alkaline phosphatase n=1 Tax=uncultured Hymenobacter sp. TaxID=170016 RepID=UPI0035CB1472